MPQIVSVRLRVTEPGPFAPPPLTDTLARLLALSQAVQSGVVRLRFAPVDGDADLYDYIWEASDGRIWRQTLRFVAGVPARQTFDVRAPGFTLDEFAAHRVVRDDVLVLRQHHGVTELRVEIAP